MEDKRFVVDEQPPAVFKHFCNPGDLVAMMASIKAYYQKTNRKVIVAQQLNLPANYYNGASHGTLSDADGTTMVCMNNHIYDMIRPLITSQEYIADMQVYDGQQITVDLDVIREKTFVNLPNGAIQSWPMFAYPDLAYNIAKPWVDLPATDLPIIGYVKNKIIINFTERYRNGHVNYFFLRKFKDRLVFAGTEKEYLLFCNAWGIDMPRLNVSNFLELAYALKHCKFLLSNQSMCWNIATSIDSPRVLEVCRFAQNCMPFYGDYSFGYLNQQGLEYYVDILTC